MQEIAPHVTIETGFPGVTLGAITGTHGLVLIDAPFRAEDTRSWRTSLSNLSGGVERLLVNLDAHIDRTLGSRAMDCTVVGHDRLTEVFRNRPVTFKTQGTESGAEWEQYNGLGSIRWASPEVTFTEELCIRWDDAPVVLQSRPGPAVGSIWAVLPEQHVAFIGDAVVKNQPPFLGSAALPAWIETLKILLAAPFQDYLLISGRGGLVVQDEVHGMLELLTGLHQKLDEMANASASVEEVERLSVGLLKGLDAPAQRHMQFRQRWHWGLHHYYLRHYRSGSADPIEE
jgi:glyoxylase-like metal-dependent hydrolase (beta-lactamase superfamily II)